MKLCLILLFLNPAASELTQNDMDFLNELPLDKLLRLKNSLQNLVKDDFDNTTLSTPVVETFGAQALPLHAPVKRTDYDDGLLKKGEYGKMSNIFSLAVTTLAFLAFGGYLLCLIVQAVKAKHNYYNMTTQQPAVQTVFFSGIKKRPETQFSSYGRRKRENREVSLDLPPEQLFSALLGLCEGYAKWTDRHDSFPNFI